MAAERVTGLPSYLGRYNSYNVPLTDEEEKLEAGQGQQQGLNAESSAQQLYETPFPRKDANIHDIAESFAGRDKVLSDFSFGNEIETLDMQKAISDMQGDRLLQEYQYFVGSAQESMGNVISNTADGTVIRLN